MEILAAVLILIFVLHLIDKHNRWVAAVEVVLALVALALLGFGGLYGWSKYSDWEDAKKQESEAQIQKAKQDACVARMKSASKGWSDDTQANAQYACLANPDAPGADQAAKSAGDWFDANQPGVPKPKKPVYTIGNLPEKQAQTKVLCTYGIGLTTQEYGTLIVDHVDKGEIVTLMSDDGTKVRVRKNNGTAGWADAYAFEVVKVGTGK